MFLNNLAFISVWAIAVLSTFQMRLNEKASSPRSPAKSVDSHSACLKIWRFRRAPWARSAETRQSVSERVSYPLIRCLSLSLSPSPSSPAAGFRRACSKKRRACRVWGCRHRWWPPHLRNGPNACNFYWLQLLQFLSDFDNVNCYMFLINLAFRAIWAVTGFSLVSSDL